MKRFLREYLDIFVYVLCGVILICGSYNLIFNINQAKALRRNTIVRDNDINYKEYKGNILIIENEIKKINNESVKNRIRHVLSLMEEDGVYKLFPYDKITSLDVYNLNNYFIDSLINDGWTASLKNLVKGNDIYDNYVKSLVNNYEYIDKELLDNSNYWYKVDDTSIRDNLEEQYKSVLTNYCLYSRMIITIVKDLGDNNVKKN